VEETVRLRCVIFDARLAPIRGAPDGEAAHTLVTHSTFKESQTMTRTKKIAAGALAIALLAAPAASAVAGGYGPHHGGHGHYGYHYNTRLPPGGARAAGVAVPAAALVPRPLATRGAPAARPRAYSPPAPAPGNYSPPQGNAAPGYGAPAYAPRAYYPA